MGPGALVHEGRLGYLGASVSDNPSPKRKAAKQSKSTPDAKAPAKRRRARGKPGSDRAGGAISEATADTPDLTASSKRNKRDAVHVIPKPLTPTKSKGAVKKVVPKRTTKSSKATKGDAARKPATKSARAKPKGPVIRPRQRGPVRVGGHKVAKGTASNILLKISEYYTHQGVYMPVAVIRGARPGPRVFLTAAVHGDEINGVQIIREVIDRIDPATLRGTVVAVPVVNRFGFASQSRYMPDRRDLNRSFPGSPDGSTTSRVAHIVMKEIIEPCDYGIDLHTAGYQRHNLPQIRADMTHPEVRRIAKAFGGEVILDAKGLKGTLRRTATDSGVPTIIYEAGETFRFQRDAITKGVEGVLNVLKELKMVKGEQLRPRYQVIVKSSEWVRAHHGGIMETLVEAGDLVYEGESIAKVANPFGRTVDEVVAPFDGIVVGITVLPLVHPGTPICHMVRLKKTLATVAKHHEQRHFDTIAQEDLEDMDTVRLEEDDVDG